MEALLNELIFLSLRKTLFYLIKDPISKQRLRKRKEKQPKIALIIKSSAKKLSKLSRKKIIINLKSLRSISKNGIKK